jgi:RNA polymerase sigma-70 factor (sigma-E family)
VVVDHTDVHSDARTTAFELFFERHYREIARLGYSLSGDSTAAEDLTGEVFLAVWRQWDDIQQVPHPAAYVRRIMVNKAATRVRRLVLERERLRLVAVPDAEFVREVDAGAVVDVQAALRELPEGRRACVVLRHAFDLSEADVAETLGVSQGTVKSQTSKGMAQLGRLMKRRPRGGAGR